MTGRQIAIIRNPRIAVEDHSGKPSLFFDAFISESHAAMQIIPLPTCDIPGLKLDVSALEGQPCWVVVESAFIRFDDWWQS